MYRRLLFVTVIIFLALCGLGILGFHSISLHREGLAGKRAAEFMEVAEQIRLDVKRKLDTFIQTEQDRAYTDYQYYYVPQTTSDRNILFRSPLAGALKKGLAYGYFQIEPDGSVITPYYLADEDEQIKPEVKAYISRLENNLLAALNGSKPAVISLGVERQSWVKREEPARYDFSRRASLAKKSFEARKDSEYSVPETTTLLSEQEQADKKVASKPKVFSDKSKAYRIDSLQKSQQLQVESRTRANVMLNIDNSAQAAQEVRDRRITQPGTQTMDSLGKGMVGGRAGQMQPQPKTVVSEEDKALAKDNLQIVENEQQKELTESVDKSDDIVQIRKEPFMTFKVPDTNRSKMFGGDVYLLRHVQIEQKHFLQGFKLEERELKRQVTESADRFLRNGMGYEISNAQRLGTAHRAILEFDFGMLPLSLIELEPGWIGRQISTLRNWYFAIVIIVFLAVILAITGIWRSARSQLRLAQKKDDFISAVSHELRTPLTSIRMYTEMLDKGWVRSDSKRSEYYSSMHQESERLSRLIENVLDFSRIQKGRKKYVFQLGDINTCIGEVVDMMAPYAAERGFTLSKDFEEITQMFFDHDAVMQIVINLIDNAIKYSDDAKEKIVFIRTKRSDNYVQIEVEDRGPGVPHLQRKKVFEEFYRIGDESVREAPGTGLGLALVKKFAEAHEGFVDILTAKPKGSIFRVTLALKA
jgi:signal transduction histidine kinase